jgi:hypothetical protein
MLYDIVQIILPRSSGYNTMLCRNSEQFLAQVATLGLGHLVEQTSWTNCTAESNEGGGWAPSLVAVAHSTGCTCFQPQYYFSSRKKIVPNTTSMVTLSSMDRFASQWTT